jgi:hypothetical protein
MREHLLHIHLPPFWLRLRSELIDTADEFIAYVRIEDVFHGEVVSLLKGFAESVSRNLETFQHVVKRELISICAICASVANHLTPISQTIFRV